MHFELADDRAAADTADHMRDRAFLTTLGRELRERRAALGLKQVDLAELAGCSTRFVHTAEAGKATARLDKLLDLLAVLGLRLQVETLDGSAPEPPSDPPPDRQ